jgi:hypothetical protein
MQDDRRYQLAVTLYVFRWDRPGLPGRKGQLCKVNARGKMNSCAIEFLDGFRAVVSRNAIKKYRGEVGDAG